jgi:pyruvate, water dikinase
MKNYIRSFKDIRLGDIKIVGGKNASLGEMTGMLESAGIRVPEGFAVTVDAYWDMLEENGIKDQLSEILNSLDKKQFSNLKQVSVKAKELISNCVFPEAIKSVIIEAYKFLSAQGELPAVAVRSSATAEDLPGASFAGQHESFLNIKGENELIEAIKKCFASLFTERAIKYREDKGFGHMLPLSVGIQRMVRADLACSGVCFTLEPESGHENIILVTGAWGLGENVVQGNVIPDEFYIFKPSLATGKKAILSKKLGDKAKTLTYDHERPNTTINTETPPEKREQFVLTDTEIISLAHWTLIIETHYKMHMDIEWAKDGLNNEIYIVQARPETAHGEKTGTIITYALTEKGKILSRGVAVGEKIVSGIVRKLDSPAEIDKVQQGDILVTDITSPDWDPVLKKVSAIITNKGGRTSHAAIVAREMGAAAIVGTGNATELIADGASITVSCAEGRIGFIYEGMLKWEKTEIDTGAVLMPETKAMIIIADPEKAYTLSMYPNDGVGLLRLEFAITNEIKIHPMALAKFENVKDEIARAEIEKITRGYPDKKSFFIDKLSQAVATIAAAFYPKDVIVRMSDFKSNEYSNLIGGKEFEPVEENPMLGFRGASRYYNERYRDGFRLECEAMKVVRNEMGLTNVKLMIPFCRTVEEGKKVIAVMREFGLARGDNGLQIYVMAEIPSNILLAEEFADVFDGFSIGSNDLTQLTLGIDRDSQIISGLFSEENEAVLKLIAMVLEKVKLAGSKIGLCGQAPSDIPEFAYFLVEHGIDSISFNPDALMKGIKNMVAAEQQLHIAY